MEKETMVPYKICSFDIEASSSHGDFPLAKKDYKKLAMNIVDCWRERSKEYDIDKTQGKIILKQFLKTAFSIGNSKVENIEKVYPKHPLKEKNFTTAFENWFETVLDEYNKDKNIFIQTENTSQIPDSQTCDEGYNNNETDDARQGGWWTNKKRLNNKINIKGNIVDVLNDDKIDRDTKINIVNKTLNEECMFPRLEGDKVTFIGSTFKYGDDAPIIMLLILDCAAIFPISKIPK